jgi:hypothetical protein
MTLDLVPADAGHLGSVIFNCKPYIRGHCHPIANLTYLGTVTLLHISQICYSRICSAIYLSISVCSGFVLACAHA